MKRKLAWFLIDVLDPVNHWLFLERDLGRWLPDRIAMAIFELPYRFCCWACALDMKWRPEGWEWTPEKRRRTYEEYREWGNSPEEAVECFPEDQRALLLAELEGR